MYKFLPDEILKEILTPALSIPDQLFSATDRNSPFARYSERSTSDYLLVCKDWLRVATPLLYGAVVLRSKGQIQALESALKSTSDLGRLIKRIRIEGGYCPSLHYILKASVNLTDLFLSTEVYSSDSITGISKGLQHIQPQRVIFNCPDRPVRGQKAEQFISAIFDTIPKWTRLTDVVLSSCSWWYCQNDDIQSIISGLQRNNTVSSVRLTSYVDECMARDLLKIPRVRRLHIENPSNKLQDLVKGNPKISKRIILGSQQEKITPETKKIAQPPASLGRFNSLSDNIWGVILSHALGNPELQDTDFRNRPLVLSRTFKPSYRQSIALLCKRFYKLVIALYYECIAITSEADLESLERFLARNPKKGKLLKSLYLVPLPRYWYREPTAPEFVIKIFAVAPNLQRVLYLDDPKSDGSLRPITWKALHTLSSKAGPRLLDLELLFRQTLSRTENMNILTRFRALKNLAFNGGSINFDPDNIPADGLSQLESLACITSDKSFLCMMTLMELPNINEIHFPIINECNGAPTFLRKHGHKLEILEIGFIAGLSVFDTCKNLRTFILPKQDNGFPVAEFFSSSEEHPLEYLHIKTTDVSSSTSAALKEKFGYLDDVDLSNFTLLLRMKFDYAKWPINERGIKNNPWVRWAEHFKEKYDIDVYDKAEQVWVPRVKPKGRNRK